MGATAAIHLRKIVENVSWIIAIETLCACQGVECRRPLTTTPVLEAALALVRQAAPRLVSDRPLSGDIDAVSTLIQSGELRLSVGSHTTDFDTVNRAP